MKSREYHRSGQFIGRKWIKAYRLNLKKTVKEARQARKVAQEMFFKQKKDIDKLEKELNNLFKKAKKLKSKKIKGRNRVCATCNTPKNKSEYLTQYAKSCRGCLIIINALRDYNK